MMMVTDYLFYGSQNCRSGADLSRVMGVPVRQIQRMVEAERRSGAAICASCDMDSPGYFLAETELELEQYIETLDGRINELTRTSAALTRTLEAMRRK